MKKAALHNLGCKVNAYETEAMRQLLEDAGYEITAFSDVADVYVVNTCSVTGVADHKSRQMLHRARKKNPSAVVVAAGCYVQTGEGRGELDGIADLIVGNNEKHRLPALLAEYESSRIPVKCVADLNGGTSAYEELSLRNVAEHTRAFVKVQDGCNQFCSYCIIPYARGRIRSRRQEDVLAEIRALVKNGCLEVVLTGIHLGSYGRDTGESLSGLIAAVCAVEGVEHVRLGSLEPGVMTEEFVSALAVLPKLCPHFHLSLQSGCDTVLSRMNRHYTTAEYEAVCARIRTHFTHPAITTDVIVGFPGETEEEFGETLAFLRRIRFYELHIFKYSRRAGTKAADLPDQVPEQKKAERSAVLFEEERRMSREFRDYYIGKTVTALTEETCEIDGVRYVTGYTKEYLKVALLSETERTNCLVRGTVSGQLAQDLYLLVEF